MSTENEIRDELACSLHVLEAGLTLVEKNFPLDNRHGAKGFVDIIARDALGNYVIVELKKSTKSSREALFEILKYASLIRSMHGLRPHQIRCMIVSTTWHELLVPFSEFCMNCEYQTIGFQIDVNDTGTVLLANRVKPINLGTGEEFFRVHCAYCYPSEVQRNQAIPKIEQLYRDSGALGFIVFFLEKQDPSPALIYPFAAYFVPTSISESAKVHLMNWAMDDISGPEETPDEAILQISIQDRFFATVHENEEFPYIPGEMEVCPGSLERFTSLIGDRWSISKTLREGSFSNRKIHGDNDLARLATGVGGSNSRLMDRIVSASCVLDWNDAMAGLERTLAGNSLWREGSLAFLRDKSLCPSHSIAHIHVFNPMDLLQAIYQLRVSMDHRFLPILSISVVSDLTGETTKLIGCLEWNGSTVPVNAESVIRGLNPEVYDFSDYLLGRAIGMGWTYDELLMDRHGLRYGLFIAREGEAGHLLSQVQVKSGGIVEMDRDNWRSIFDFLMTADAYVDSLCRQFDTLTMWIK